MLFPPAAEVQLVALAGRSAAQSGATRNVAETELKNAVNWPRKVFTSRTFCRCFKAEVAHQLTAGLSHTSSTSVVKLVISQTIAMSEEH